MKKKYIAPKVEVFVIREPLMLRASGLRVDNKKEGEVEDPEDGNNSGASGGMIWGDND